VKIVIFVVLAVIVVIGGGVALFPMSVAADYARKQVPDFHYADASGSVWDGRLTNVSFGQQKIGDLAVKADFGQVFSGKAAGHLGLTREGFAGEGGLAYGIGGDSLTLTNLKLNGKTAMVRGMPPAVAAGEGKFSLDVKDLKFVKSACQSASGEVWTDALSKVSIQGWVGPELRGPVSCANGKLVAEGKGKAATGEDVLAQMVISPHLDIEMVATVTNTQPTSVNALTSLGFKPDGDAYVLRASIGGR
jgi:hypothetical protein